MISSEDNKKAKKRKLPTAEPDETQELVPVSNKKLQKKMVKKMKKESKRRGE